MGTVISRCNGGDYANSVCAETTTTEEFVNNTVSSSDNDNEKSLNEVEKREDATPGLKPLLSSESNSNQSGDHMTNDAMMNALLSANAYCGLNLNFCTSETLKKLTMARTAQSRFLVQHKMDKPERWLLSQVKVLEGMDHEHVNRPNSLLEVETNTDLSNSNKNPSEKAAEDGDTSDFKVEDQQGVIGRYASTAEGKQALNSENPSSLLRLTMRANFSTFYHTVYLRRFPQQVIKKGSALARTVDLPGQVTDKEANMLRSAMSVDTSNTQRNGQYDALRSIRHAYSKDVFMRLGIQGSLGLLAALKGDVSGTGGIRRSPKKTSMKQLVLIDLGTRAPVAVCALKSLYGPPVVRIHSPNPSIFCQAPSAGIKFEGRALYPWAEIRVEGEFPLPVRYSVSLAIGNDRFESEPSYRGSHLRVGSPDISVVGKTEKESVMSGCAIITLGKGGRSNDRFYISIARGVDPSLFLCFAAVVDEILEHTMRMQYIHSNKPSYQTPPI